MAECFREELGGMQLRVGPCFVELLVGINLLYMKYNLIADENVTHF